MNEDSGGFSRDAMLTADQVLLGQLIEAVKGAAPGCRDHAAAVLRLTTRVEEFGDSLLPFLPLIESADKAFCEAKRSGKNRVMAHEHR